MKNAIRLAPSAACVSLLLLGCERQDRVLAPETHRLALAASLASTATLTNVVTDPEGDMFLPANLARQAHQDIVRAEISKQGTSFVFTMEMAGRIPEAPELAPPGIALLEWSWRLNVNPATFPAGLPYAPGIASPGEYRVQILWDGTRFIGQVIDRTALLTGREAVVTPLSFSIEGAQLRTSVNAALVGDPSSFLWSVEAADWSGPLGTMGNHPVDLAPNGAPAIWPS